MIGERRAEYAGVGTRELYVDGAGPTLVLVHGFGHPAPCWRPVLQRCAAAGQAAIAVDLPGFGQADPPSTGPFLPQLVRFLRAVVTTHGIGTPVVLVGNSLGASAAVRLLDTESGLPVRGLLALDTATDRWTPLMKAGMTCRGRTLAALARLPIPGAIFGQSAKVVGAQLLYGDYRLADPAVVALLTDQLSSRRVRSDFAVLGGRLMVEVAVVATAHDIAYPTVFVHGTRDKLVAVAASKRLHAANPQSRLELLDGVGHCPQLDAPDHITALALQLAGAVGGTRTGAI
ncbi:hypothetical protein A5740_15380 [Mycobacterium sp. GA-1841]|uniref:alpha/beta fold hydrolase n=1 Tax=Mycobacterium sp. GA-1841 TaxID=1834154 RepID=UPI00096DBBB3|nr:alpha/beta hydrolase [Mycobacterium sp. GA-1841]OMC31215.1 hypothetical protein A5740_15380 [Mycobacterium sp. GA-1841]